MKLTVLGNNGPYPAAGGACSGYLLQHNKRNILLDCGSGVISNLQKIIKLNELDAVILTHLHSDHVSDIMLLKYAIQTCAARGLPHKITDVYAPDEPAEEYARLDVRNAFNLKPITNDLELKFGELLLTFHHMNHPYKCFGVAAEAGSKKIVYSGDTAEADDLLPFFKDADALFLDSGLLESDKTGHDVHLTSSECGRIGAEAGVRKLFLTHFAPDFNIEEQIREAAVFYPAVKATLLMKEYKF
jgi:ribonuclease BN (tRNA processing enzyme)